MILLAEYGFTPADIWAMPILELSAWLESHLESKGVKKAAGTKNSAGIRHESFVFTQRGKLGH